MRLETLDMRFLLTVGFSLRTRTDNMKNNEAIRTCAIPSPLAEKVAAGGASTLLSASTNCHLMTEEVFPPPNPRQRGRVTGRHSQFSIVNSQLKTPLPSSDSGTELPFAKLLLLSAATFSSKRRRNLSLRWLKPTTITPLNIEP